MKHGEESELKMTQGDFKIALKGNELYIQIIECLSSKLWADKWGKIEKKLVGEDFQEIHLILSG